MRSQNKRQCLVVFLFVVFVAIGLLPFGYMRLVAWGLSDFKALKQTADALHQHVVSTKQWPVDWDSLSPYASDLEFLQKRVEVNFDVDVGFPPGKNKWYLRLKSVFNDEDLTDFNNSLDDVIQWANQ